MIFVRFLLVPWKGLLTAGVAIALTPFALSQVLVVPSSFSSAEADHHSDLPFSTGASVGQYLFESSQFGFQVGDSLTGVAFRLDANPSQPTGPAANRNFTDYEIRLGPAATTAETMSDTFANNFSSSQLVR